MPFAGMGGSDLPRASGFATVRDPYGGGEVVVIPPIRPDVSLIHVQEADEEGNLRIIGSPYEDVLLAKASARIIATAERIVPHERFMEQPELTALPGFLVDTIVEAPRGAWPTSCAGEYGFDKEFLSAYAAAAKSSEGFAAFLQAVASPVATGEG
ncbi:MAG TPA: CoA-transferase [Chloroflexota bacterium]